jgi:ubiquinone/menaquinone biosynthesis C-methylase UbiE
MLKRMLLVYHDWKTRRKMERVFGRREDPYGYYSHPHELQKQEILESLLSDRRYGAALEIGCAEGAFTRRLAGHCESVTAVDISRTAIRRAQEHLRDASNVRFIRSNARELDLSPKRDLIVISEVLYYLQDGELLERNFNGFLAQVSRALNPGARLVVLHSFGNEAERAVRRSYVQTFLADPELRLVKEFAAGDDPKKCKYLVSLLEKTLAAFLLTGVPYWGFLGPAVYV